MAAFPECLKCFHEGGHHEAHGFNARLDLAVGIAVGVIGSQVLNAQQELSPPPVKRTLIVKTKLEGIEGKDVHAWVTEFAPGARSGKNYHPWHEFVYVLEGTFTIEAEGRPPVTLQPGEIIHLAPKQVHEGKNASETSPLKLLVFGMGPKGQPLVFPVK